MSKVSHFKTALFIIIIIIISISCCGAKKKKGNLQIIAANHKTTMYPSIVILEDPE